MKSPTSQVRLDVDIETTVFPKYLQLSNVLVCYGRKVLLIHRKTEPFSGTWSIPGGGKSGNETYLATGCRELYEETHIKTAKLDPLYIFIDHEHQLESHLYQYKNSDGKFINSEHSEHDAMQWEDIGVAMTRKLTPGLYEALQTIEKL